MLGHRRVLVDSSAYFALADRGSDDHRFARAVSDRLASEQWRTFTTNYIVAETHALVLIRKNRFEAARVLRLIDTDPDTTIVRASAKDERRAREIIDRYVEP